MKGPDRRTAPNPLDVLTTDQVARWFQTTARTIQRRFRHLPDMPGRYLVADILEQIKAKRGKAA